MNLNKIEKGFSTLLSLLGILLLLAYTFLSVFKLGVSSSTWLAGSSIIVIGSYLYLIFGFVKKNQSDGVDFLNLGTQRYVLGLFMIAYGIPKLFGSFFDYQLFALDQRMVDTSDFELAWYFYGKNKWQELISGLLEFIPALFLFHKRTYFGASVVLLFVTSQIFVLNTFSKIGGVTFYAAAILLAINISLLYSQKNRIIEIFKSHQAAQLSDIKGVPKKLITTLKAFAAVLAISVFFIVLKPYIYKSAATQKYNSLVGKYTLVNPLINGKSPSSNHSYRLYEDIYIEKQHRWNILRDNNGKLESFVLQLYEENDSLRMYINNNGIGDGAVRIDSASILSGTYTLENDTLSILGTQKNNHLDLTYIRQDLPRKSWFW